MPRYRENPLITPFSMLCPGISQNTKHHHLTLYKGQVWGEKSYLELCNHNILNIVYDGNINYGYQEVIYYGEIFYIHQNGELYVPPAPGYGFINDRTQIPWDSEILQSFAWLTDITNINFYYFSQEDATYQIRVILDVKCELEGMRSHHEQCTPAYGYFPWYIWTKEGLKIQKYEN